MIRKLLLVLACLVCFAVMLCGAFVCIMGLEALTTGLNPLPWWQAFGLLIVLPGIGLALALKALFSKRG